LKRSLSWGWLIFLTGGRAHFEAHEVHFVSVLRSLYRRGYRHSDIQGIFKVPLGSLN